MTTTLLGLFAYFVIDNIEDGIKRYRAYESHFRSAPKIEYVMKRGDNITKLCRAELTGTEWENLVAVCRDDVCVLNRIVCDDEDNSPDRRLPIGYKIKIPDLNGNGMAGR